MHIYIYEGNSHTSFLTMSQLTLTSALLAESECVVKLRRAASYLYSSKYLRALCSGVSKSFWSGSPWLKSNFLPPFFLFSTGVAKFVLSFALAKPLSLGLFLGVEKRAGLLGVDAGVAGLESFLSTQVLFWDPFLALVLVLNTFQQ